MSFAICRLSFVICHLSFVICHLSFVICHLSFVIEDAQLPASSPSSRQSNPPAHSMRRHYLPPVGAGNGTAR